MSLPPLPRIFPASATATTGSSTHLGVPRLRPRIPKSRLPPFSHPSLPKNDHPSPTWYRPLLSDSCIRRPPAVSEIFFNLAYSCCSAASCRHNGLRNPPLLPCIPSTLHLSKILTEGPPTTLLPLASCRYIPAAVKFLSPEVPCPVPTLYNSRPLAFTPSPLSPVVGNPHVPPRAC